MRLTVTKKITIGLIIIVGIGVLSMLFIYRGLNAVGRDVERLAEVEEPLILAAYEMEINMNGIGLAVLKYLSARNPRYRAWAEKDLADFDGFYATYAKLISSAEERALNDEVSRRFAAFRVLAVMLMQRADEQEIAFNKTNEHIEAVDELVEKQLHSRFKHTSALTQREYGKALAAAKIEAEIAELGFWATNYQLLQKPAYKNSIAQKTQSFQAALAALQSQSLTASEQRVVDVMRDIFTQVQSTIRTAIVLEDAISLERDEFIILRAEMDDIFDDKMQPLALQALAAPRQSAKADAEAVLQTMVYLIPLFLLSALLVGVLLVRLITQPLYRLTRGTQAIGQGNLNYRLAPRGKDELADLGRAFNRMVEQLQTTTVSRDLLEESEEKLQATVSELRHEIVERERAEHERESLQEALRRAAILSAMGELVANVAHEVRNPLFGISATLDAMETRFADRQEYKNYTTVLHREVNRLRKLMLDLIEYGKPATPELKLDSMLPAMVQAMQACVLLAQEAEVRIVQRSEPELPPVRHDVSRLAQVFGNLLENAILHTPPSGEVAIELCHDGKYLHCAIRDSGSGIAKDDLPHIFDPFFTRRRGGTGLGLSIVQRIVDDHGGLVVAANHAEGGAIVTVSLPIGATPFD